MMTTDSTPDSSSWRLPAPAIAAALVALAALYFTSGGFILLPVFAVGLLAACLSPVRIPDRSLLRWILRFVLFATILAFNLNLPVNGSDVSSGYARVVAELCAAELVVEAWRERPDAQGLGTLVLTALVFIGAADTMDVNPIRYLSPAYLLFTMMAIRRLPLGRTWGKASPDHRAGPASAIRWMALMLALTVGVGAYWGVWTYRAQITLWAGSLLTPRLPQRDTGLSLQPELGSSFNRPGNTTRMLILDGPPVENHLRAASFDFYVSGRWGPLVSARMMTPALGADLGTAGTRPVGADSPVTVTRLVDSARLVYAPLHVAAVVPSQAGDLEWDRSDGLLISGPSDPYTYQIVASPDPDHQGPLCDPLSASERRRCLQVPQMVDPRVTPLAHSITHSRSDRQRVADVIAYLQSHHGYSLTFHRGPTDPVSSFLLGRQPAHCEYFASAATILLRILGVPTRYVIGYYAHEADGPNRIVVRGRDAHAWAESWINGIGWMTVDATPASGRPDALAGPLPIWQRLSEWVQDELRRLIFHPSLRDTLLAAAPVALVVVCAVSLLAWRRARRRRAVPPAHTFAPTSPELARLQAQFEAALRRAGVPCPPGRTWTEHLRDLELRRSASDSAIRLDPRAAGEFVALYNAARFGAPDEEKTQRARRALQDIHEPSRPGS